MKPIIKVIIPAYNEQDSIANVVNDIPKIVDEIIVISNNSTDNTKINAKNAGATVLSENKKGYGFACLKGLQYISEQAVKPEIIVFLDGDYSDYPEQLTEIIAPIINDNIDFVIGSRVKRLREIGSMTPQQ
ncbi:MAG: glycosyltransferase involved in cell wall biosynthesis, partial [Polaribacter sp.]